MKKTKLKYRGTSETSVLKERIQELVREVVILRDKGCILKKLRHCEDSVLQADHLITRRNSATYADTRLIVCLCRSCHGWKHWHEKQYDALVKTLLPKDRVELWDKCEKDSWRPVRVGAWDWKMAIVALEKELKNLSTGSLDV